MKMLKDGHMDQLDNIDGVPTQIKKGAIDVFIKCDRYEEPTWEPT